MLLGSPRRRRNSTMSMTKSVTSARSFSSAARKVKLLNVATRSKRPGTKSSQLDRRVSRISLLSGPVGTPAKSEKSEKDVPEKLETLFNRCETLEASVIQNIKKIEQTHAAVKADVTKFRKQVNDVLDTWEKDICNQINDIMEADLASLEAVLSDTRKLAEEMQNSANEVTEYQTKLMEINIIETEAKNVFREYKFSGNENISELIKTESDLGDVNITQDVAGLYNDINGIDNFIPTYLEEINVKTKQDSLDCDITGMTMIGAHKLIIADADNKSVKSVDPVSKKVTSQLHLSAGPWDVATVHRGQVAVTIPSEKVIQFIMTTGGLSLDHHIKVTGACHGITFYQDSLIVTFRNPGKVQIMDLKGHVFKSIHTVGSQNKLFSWPDYVSVSKLDESIYVSDWQKNTVTRLSWRGEVTGIYKDGPGTKMAGVAVAEDGSVYVCKRSSHSIVKLSPDLSESKLVLEEKHGLKFPWSLCFCDEEGTLYVDNNRNSNTISVFEMV
ncbi:hypothetical protein ACF0H5_002938 [Mactra antiquata]